MKHHTEANHAQACCPQEVRPRPSRRHDHNCSFGVPLDRLEWDHDMGAHDNDRADKTRGEKNHTEAKKVGNEKSCALCAGPCRFFGWHCRVVTIFFIQTCFFCPSLFFLSYDYDGPFQAKELCHTSQVKKFRYQWKKLFCRLLSPLSMLAARSMVVCGSRRCFRRLLRSQRLPCSRHCMPPSDLLWRVP